MSTFLPKEVQDGLAKARERAMRKSTRMRVGAPGDQVAILKFAEGRFEVSLRDAPSLRGLVDIYDGARHLYQALIVASSEDGDRMVYEFKRMTPTSDAPALDYDRPDETPVALLPRDVA